MSFIEEYKRLEKLCGDILNNERKVSAYIDEMTNLPNGSYLVPGWESDLKRLKHYRWIRNQIVHDPGCFEEDMCANEDVIWIRNFRERIMNCTDPLAQYRRAALSQHIHADIYQKRKAARYYSREDRHMAKRPSGCAAALFFAVLLLFLPYLLALILNAGFH